MPNGRKRKIVDGLDDEETYRDISIKVKLGRLRPPPDLRAAIEDATCRVHDIVARGLLLANHTLIRELAFERFPDITSQSWWLNCIKIWGTIKVQKGPPPKIDPRVREAYETLKDRPGMSQVPMDLIVHTINQVVEILMANTWTHVAQNFHNFLRKAFQREFSIFETDVRRLTDKERNCARESAMRHSLGGEIFWDPVVRQDLRQRLESVYVPWTSKYEKVCPVKDAQFINKEDCPDLIRWMADLSAHRDRCAAREDVEFYKGCMRTHRLIPLGSLKVRHILITKTVFKEELLPLARRIRKSKSPKDQDPVFEDYFPGILKLKPCPGAVFADYFATDGVSVSLRYKKPAAVPMSAVMKRYKKDKGFVTVEGEDMKSAHPPRLPREGERLVALDPGRRDVVFGSVYGSDETVHLSTGQLCHDSGRRWSKRQSDKVFSAIQHQDMTLADAKANLPSSKTSSWAAWETFVAAYVPLLQVTLDVWKRNAFARRHFGVTERKTSAWTRYARTSRAVFEERLWPLVEPHPAQQVVDTPRCHKSAFERDLKRSMVLECPSSESVTRVKDVLNASIS